MNQPTDAYEWSLLAVPAQREAGGHKDVCKDERGMTVEQIIQKMKETQEGLFLSEEEIRKMLRHLEQMEEYAACGEKHTGKK